MAHQIRFWSKPCRGRLARPVSLTRVDAVFDAGAVAVPQFLGRAGDRGR